ncbi:MAG: DEAD/DEAH box helicase, partial [Verrucomicrobiota bacterium]
MPIPIPSGLDRHVRFLWGVGPERSTQLARLAIHTVFDLLLHRPLRYEDRRQVLPIRALELGKASSARGRIVALGVKRYRQKTRSIFEFVLDDGTARLHCRWWNLPYLEDYYAQGDEVLVHGKVLSLRPRTIDHPETEIIDGGEESSIHLNRIAPIYPLTEGLPQRWLRALIWRTLQECDSMIGEPWPDLAAEISRALSSPPQIKSNFDLLSRREAIRFLHFPNELRDADRARQRLAFEEFLDLQLAIQTRRKNFLAKARSRPCPGNNQWIKPFLAGLGFALTPAQTRVLRDMRADLSRGRPMRRLLQGEVGSGKTVVAACTALMVLESGFNVVLMAPTEILAEQHYRNFRKWFEPLGIAVGICTGSFKTVSRDQGKSSAPTPVQTHPSLVIGTHALIEEAFAIADLGLVIIDEQHKFGVAQREQLVRKGEFPHLLVMTATPIPRTLGLTLYGDLDLSVIDELPPDRGR